MRWFSPVTRLKSVLLPQFGLPTTAILTDRETVTLFSGMLIDADSAINPPLGGSKSR